MGAKISGLGSHTITIEGVSKLTPTTHATLADRIVSGTWAFAAAMTQGDITIENGRAEHLEVPLDKLVEAAPVVTPPSSGGGGGGGSTYVAPTPAPTPTVDPAVSAAAAAKALADAKAAQEKAAAEAKALSEKKAAEEAALLATIKALQEPLHTTFHKTFSTRW